MRITATKIFKLQLLVIKYESNTRKISQIKSTQNPMCNTEECHTVNYMVF